MTTIYGIHNCDTVKKALKWLDSANIEYTFHDLRKDGLNADLLADFSGKSDWSSLINKRSTTYRNLAQDVKDNLQGDVAANTVLEQVTLLKRPLLMHNGELHLGFKAAQYQELFGHE
ncbi:Spx/MgsR family RNA polymerase-binding regulatory protein [Thalassotalea sp. HSM 43]|uniref:Spx/MgsR family RNA polymerase-binding regulatory protein n=1 Tax=Thalassotalea sp. HSM 43 TaxID=2552945 RepID=UPI001080E034|nr:Spx/MgsR family RNA polymerase-binding regulatory protein [Thalassotalea sp. HSM 43]QBY03022.1 Spx/MgsR family RNA polymerase-binding regulatory protein [Thalassotalea sp. HSM 43]